MKTLSIPIFILSLPRLSIFPLPNGLFANQNTLEDMGLTKRQHRRTMLKTFSEIASRSREPADEFAVLRTTGDQRYYATVGSNTNEQRRSRRPERGSFQGVWHGIVITLSWLIDQVKTQPSAGTVRLPTRLISTRSTLCLLMSATHT
jgi:hypothetical protein